MGVELMSKLLNIIIVLLQMTNGEETTPKKIYKKSLKDKIDEFLKLSDGKYDSFIDGINRPFRNSTSHLDCTFNLKQNAYIYCVGNTRKVCKMSGEDMVLKYYPSIGWVIQGFMYAGMLLILAHEDEVKYKQAIAGIFNDVPLTSAPRSKGE